MLCLHELFAMFDRAHPVAPGGLRRRCSACWSRAHYGGRRGARARAASLCVPLMFVLVLQLQPRGGAPGLVGDDARRLAWIGLAPRARGAAARPARTATASSSTCSSARSSATPAPTSAGAPSAPRRWRRRSRPTRRSRAWSIGIVVAVAAVWFAGLYQDWLSRRPTRCCSASAVALAAPLGDLFESLPQARRRHEGHRDALRRPRRARWTASTR